jgi:hypothetical protein
MKKKMKEALPPLSSSLLCCHLIFLTDITLINLLKEFNIDFLELGAI